MAAVSPRVEPEDGTEVWPEDAPPVSFAYEAAALPLVWAPHGLQAETPDERSVVPQAEIPDEQSVSPLFETPDEPSVVLLDAVSAQAESHGDSQVSSRELPCEPETGSQASLPDAPDFRFWAGSPADAHSAAWPWDAPFPGELQADPPGVFQDGLRAAPPNGLQAVPDEPRAAPPDDSQAVPRVCSCYSPRPVLRFPALSPAGSQVPRC